ncbi:MAG: alpha/beta fold hydrolase [Coriobacteriia bacterium]|nr:alpha/beta fold hydrolase [Coriobacteriia bacterium]
MTDLSQLTLSVRYDEGDGPVMVLLHGINSDGADWRRVIDTIGSGYRFIAVDLLGFGDSPKPEDIEYTADQHAQVLDQTLNAIGVDRPFLLVGYSLGGDIAIRYAAKYPRRVRRLFLLSAPFYLPPKAFSREAFGRQYLQVIVFQRLWKFVSNSKKRDNLLYQIVDGKAEEFAKGFLRTDDVSTHWDIMSKNLRNCIGKATFVDDLPKLDMPVTFALGIRDPIVHPDQTPALKRLKPEIDIRRIVGLSADHFLLVNLPDTVAEEIMRDEVTGLSVRYRAGKGEPIVFLHGLLQGPDFWHAVAQALSATHEVLMIDLLGFGASPRPLSYRYQLSDHVDALLHTLERELPEGQPVRIVGHGLGGNIALGVASAEPQRVVDTVAFSPLLLDAEAIDNPSSPAAAELLALRDRLRDMMNDPRTRAAAENSEAVFVPMIRTLENTVLAENNHKLVSAAKRPITLVAPVGDGIADVAYFRSLADDRDDVRVATPPGDNSMPLDDPAATVLLIEPGATQQASVAANLPRPAAHDGLRQLRMVFGSASNGVLWRGLGQLVLGIVFTLLKQPHPRVLAFGFAVWVLVEGVSTIAGAVGLRRSGKSGWIPWLLMGALSFTVAWLLLSRTELNLFVLGMVVLGRALYTAIADLYVARKVSSTPTARWLLVAEGVLGIVIALLIVFSTHHAYFTLQYLLAVYFTVSGVSSMGYALANRRAVRRRVRAGLARSRQV